MKDTFDVCKKIITEPEEGVDRFLKLPMVVLAIIAGVRIALSALFRIIDMVIGNFRHIANLKEQAERADMSFNKFCKEYDIDKTQYDIWDFVKNTYETIIGIIIGVLAVAFFVYILTIVIGRAKLTFKEALAVALIESVVIIPYLVVSEVLGIFGGIWVISMLLAGISSVVSVACVILTYLGIKEFCINTKRTIYILAVSYFAATILKAVIMNIF